MAIRPPEAKVWWNEPIARGELAWIWVAFLWGVIMFFMMVYWHVVGRQNLSTEVYRIDPLMRTRRRLRAEIQGDEGDTIPVVRPPPGSDAHMLARL
jgi:cytochrome c oxidase subunit 2